MKVVQRSSLVVPLSFDSLILPYVLFYSVIDQLAVSIDNHTNSNTVLTIVIITIKIIVSNIIISIIQYIALWRDVWMLFANGSWRYAVTNINERSPNRVRFRLSVLVPYGLIPSRMNSMRSPQNGTVISYVCNINTQTSTDKTDATDLKLRHQAENQQKQGSKVSLRYRKILSCF